MAAATSGGRAGAALSASESSHSRAKASWLRTRSEASCSSARRPISSAAAGQVSPRARKGISDSPPRNCSAACPVSWTQSRWHSFSGARVRGPRLSTRWPAAALWGGSRRAEPPGAAPVSDRETTHFPLEMRQTQSPSPRRVRGVSGWTSSTTPRGAVVLGE